jgi:hypothetical protein
VRRLVIVLREEGQDDVPVLDADIKGVHVEWHNDWEEIRSNQSMFALLAGAPMDVVRELPGEQVANVLAGTTITVHIPKFEVGEFRPALP